MKQFKYFITIILAAAPAPWLGAQVTYNQVPSRIVGQPALQQSGTLTMVAPNLVEGREFDGPQSLALDTSASPPILYVADASNNRILAWKNAGGFTKGDKADKVIGQRDCYSVPPQGPSQGSTALSTGLTLPTGIVVDSTGNLYVADAGNNRILRFPAPFQQNAGFCSAGQNSGTLLATDLILGQTSLATSSANQGNTQPSAQTLSLVNGSSPLRIGLALDSKGNLWVSDSGNNRVLRIPAASLTPNNNDPAADLVLGQTNFATSTVPTGVTAQSKNFLAAPSGLAFDPSGRLFVCDQGNRVLVYLPAFSTGESASRIMGVIPPTQTNPNPPAISAGTLGGSGGPPEGVFFVGNNPYVVDTGNARILQYDSYDKWPLEATSFSPVATAVIGQPDFVSNKSNQGQPQPSATSFSGPVGLHAAFEANGVVAGAFNGNNLYVADAGNNRVLVFPQQTNGSFTSANRLLGQIDFPFNSINYIEGREFFFQGSGGALVIDWHSTPPHLYVSDPGNNRVMGYLDYRKVVPGTAADLVLGQPNLYTGMVNYPKNDPNQTGDEGLFSPQGLALDSAGNLWVADEGNARVLRYPAPFAQPQNAMIKPSLVVGQTGFFQKVTDPSSQNMRNPYGIALTVLGHLLVSDAALNRVLFFIKPTGGDFTNGQLASNVIGQPSYGPPSEPPGARLLSSPRLIAVDVDDKLYVADEGNNRVVIYFQVPTLGIDPQPSFALSGFNKPLGVFSDQNTGELWVADTGNNRLLRYPQFNNLGDSGPTPAANITIPSFGPFAVALDPFDNPLAAEGSTNRVAFFYPQIDSTSSAGGIAGRFSGNAANYFQEFAPGMLASIFSFQNSHFGTLTASATSTPLPTTLGDVQVLVGGTPAPLLYASPSQINFQVPSKTPVGPTGTEFQVVKPSTGQILASNFFRIDPYAPGLFTSDGAGGLAGYSTQLAALNQDNTVNSPTKPAKGGTIIQLFGTGVGLVPGQPPDGTPAPNGLLPTSQKPQVFINGQLLQDSDVTYSGLAPGFIGLWQVNAKIPANVPTPDQQVPVAILYQGINTRLDAFGDGRTTTIRTTP